IRWLLRRAKETDRFGTDTDRGQEGDRSQHPPDFFGCDAQFQRPQAKPCMLLRDSRRVNAKLGEGLPDRGRVTLALLLENGAPLAETVGLFEHAAQLLTELVLLRREIEVHGRYVAA